jgi:hypothetical protein
LYGAIRDDASVNLGRGKGPQAASDWLLSKGIPGIRYLDAGSRDAGKGTRNIVVFDDNLPKIIKRE